MGKRVIIVSDLNGQEVEEESSAILRVSWAGRETVRELLITAQEADDLFGEAGRELKKRGRKSNGTTTVKAAAATATK